MGLSKNSQRKLTISKCARSHTLTHTLTHKLRGSNSIAMAAAAALRRMMAQDPVLTACAVLSAIGLGAPLIVPPIRNAINRPEVVAPPKLADVVEGMTGKART